MRALFAITIVAAAAGTTRADCPPTVQLDGDSALVAMIEGELAVRGIAVATPEDACPAQLIRIERRGDDLVIAIVDTSRTVREVQTAAAVIESFVRADLGSPLLAIRTIAVTTAPAARAQLDEPAPPARRELLTGWHAFAGVEGSFANDGSRWMGMSLGACVMVGPLCAAVRTRGTAVENERGIWVGTRRKGADGVAGFDVPIRLGRYLLTPGVAFGFGHMSTQAGAPESRSNNLRAQTHVALSIPLTPKLAIDATVTGTLGQQVGREPGYMTTIAEPFGFLRFGMAMRYGRR